MNLFGESYILSVAIPRPLEGLFTYKLPDHFLTRIRVGGCVRVPFGRVTTHAFIVEPPKKMSELSPHISIHQLKEVLEVSDSELYLLPDVLGLCHWAREYYSAPLGEVLNCAGPSGVFGAWISRKSLTKNPQLLSKTKVSLKREISPPPPPLDLELTHSQVRALGLLEDCRRSDGPKVALLHGVTGSGKTEIYIELAKKTLKLGRGVLILVPEIALTPQLHRRFQERLGMSVALWHSAVSVGKRRKQCFALQKGELRVIIGARSAVFAPIQDLGLIIVDEEHDPTYKQEDRVRYHARDLAIVRAKLTHSFTVLGSATPSLETLERVREGKYIKVDLNERISPGGFPRIEMVDLRVESRVQKIQAPLALKTVKIIQEVLNAGEQVIVYLNRRGFAAFLLCKDCGDSRNCSQCSVSLTVHKKFLELRCHVCGHRESIPEICGKCQGSHLFPMGAGTESLEADLPELLSGARVLRLDRDQITSSTRLEKLLDEFRSQKANILLGTQMLVKGHDFPGVTLVVVILADALFRWPDFRAPERAYQILRQVSGRSGRGEKAGRVLVQTYDPEHPVLQTLDGRLEEGTFLDSERELRQALRYPPFGRLARLRFEASIRDDVKVRSAAVAEYLQQEFNLSEGFDLLGPSEAFMERIKGVYRWDLLIKVKNIGLLQKAVGLAKGFCVSKKWQLQVDVDPYST